MKKSLIGQTVRYEGEIFQILSEGQNILTAHSYNSNCGIETTILVAKKSAKVIATKRKQRGINYGKK